MAHTAYQTATDREQYALQDLRASKAAAAASRDVPQNPFLSSAEIASTISPIEEYEELEEQDSYEDNSKTKIRSAGARPAHVRSDTVGTTNSATDGGPRRHSRINLLTPPNANASAPPIICLHASNDSCMRSWLAMVETLYKSGHTVLLYDRPPLNALGGADLKPHRAVSELCSYLYSMDLRGPYVFIAHAYGAAVARLFLQQKPAQVAGMVLVETGQETALAPSTEEEQYRRQILGDAPLAVVRGNFMRAKQDEWVKAAALARSDAQKAQLEPQRLLLERWEAEDERLKRKQLGLSRNSHFCQVPNCGAHPILERPEVVIEEVRWVMGQVSANGAASLPTGERPGLRRNISSAGAGLRRGLSTRLTSGLQRTFSKKGKV